MTLQSFHISFNINLPFPFPPYPSFQTCPKIISISPHTLEQEGQISNFSLRPHFAYVESTK